MSSKEARLSHGDCYPGRGETTENYIAMAQTAKAMGPVGLGSGRSSLG
jgi:hypothetical protein